MDSDEHGPITPSALLLIIGEPFSEDQKTLILAEITKGFRCWDVEDTGININEELAQIANRASLGEEGANGERFIQHQSDNLAVEILINPLAQSVKNSIKKLLIASSPTKYIIYAGHAFQGSGAWVLQDDTFAFNNLAQVFKNVDVENALKQNIEANLTIHTLADSNWGTSISRADFTNHLRIQLNPPEKLDNIHGVLQFTAYVGSFVKVIPITSLLQASEQFGNISFTRPTLYIFPGSQGDSALFGINGFNLLVNGGYNRRACFWDFARHLDRVDAMLMTHLGTDNIFGLNTVLQRKSLENIHPQIGYLYFNALDKVGQSSVGAEGDTPSSKNYSGLLINLAEEANKMTQMAKQLGIAPQPCTRNAASVNGEPVNLYHKLGHGSLDMYILNPVADAKELKEFNQAWSKQSANLGTSGLYPLQNVLSVCALLVWKPYNLDEKIVRICFPGNAPQHKIIEGLEKMKTFSFLKFASCTSRDLMKPPVVKKPGGTARQTSASGSARTNKVTNTSKVEIVKVQTSNRLDSPRKTDQRAPAPKPEPKTPASPTKQTKAVKDENNKKNKPKEDVKKSASVNLDKYKSSTPRPALSSPVKGMSSPGKSPSPPKAGSPVKSPSPPKLSPIKAPPKAKVPASPDVSSSSSAATGPVAGEISPAVNHVDKQELQPESDQGQNSPEVEALQALDNAVKEGIPAAYQESSVDQLSSSVDKIKLDKQDEGQQYHQNGGDAFEGEDEEIKPQALPEPPVILESPSQDSDAIPDYSLKIESDEQELSEFSRAEEEIQLERETHSYADPAQEIPSSPEPVPEEQQDQDFDYPAAVEPSSGFETPVFTHDEPAVSSSQPSMEQSIQYGIDESSSGRDMGGIQEVDEEDQDEESSLTLDKKEISPSRILEGEEAGSDVEDEFRDNVAQEIIQDRETPDTEDNISDQISPETHLDDPKDISVKLQLEDAVDEGIEDDDQSTVPAAFDKDSSPDYDHRFTGSEERDSLDGDRPDYDKDVDEIAALAVNGLSENANINSDLVNLKSAEGAVPSSLNEMENPAEAYSSHVQKECNDSVSDDESFNPIEKWGPPMGLPSPPPVRDRGATSPQKTNGADKRPNSASKATGTTRPARNDTTADSKKRPTTAPPRGGSGRPASGTKRPGTASSRTSPTNTKVPPLPPMTPFYVDLTYIPNHGDPAYSDAEFFKRIRARYYVFSSLSPNPQILDSLMEAKATWEQKDLEVTLIPTYDNETLRHWMGLNKEKLQELRIDMTPAVSRCTVQLQDLETSLPAYRLEV